VKARRWVAAALLLALVAASCSGDRADDDAAPVVSVAPADSAPTTTPSTMPSTTAAAPTTTAASSTTTTTEPHLTDEEQIDALIEEYWQAVADALDPPNPDYDWSGVATLRSAEARAAAMRENLDRNRGIGQVLPGAPFVLSSEVAFIAADRAIAFVCIRDSAFAYELDTGDVTQEASVVSRKRTEIRLLSEGWRVDRVEHLENYPPEEAAKCASALPAS